MDLGKENFYYGNNSPKSGHLPMLETWKPVYKVANDMYYISHVISNVQNDPTVLFAPSHTRGHTHTYCVMSYIGKLQCSPNLENCTVIYSRKRSY